MTTLLDLSLNFENLQDEIFECVDKVIIVSYVNLISIKLAQGSKGLLKRNNIVDIRLVLNLFSLDEFKKLDTYNNLDKVIDDAGIQLIATVQKYKFSTMQILS